MADLDWLEEAPGEQCAMKQAERDWDRLRLAHMKVCVLLTAVSACIPRWLLIAQGFAGRCLFRRCNCLWLLHGFTWACHICCLNTLCIVGMTHRYVPC